MMEFFGLDESEVEKVVVFGKKLWQLIERDWLLSHIKDFRIMIQIARE